MRGVVDCDMPWHVPTKPYSMVIGHFVPHLLRMIGREIVILRDPATWLVSVYNYAMSHGYIDMPFDEWYESPLPDGINLIGGRYDRMARWCMAYWGCAGPRGLRSMIDRAWLVGLTETIDVDFPALCRWLGISDEYERRRVTGETDEIDGFQIKRHYELDDDMCRRIYRENPEDVRLYEYAREARIPWTQKLA